MQDSKEVKRSTAATAHAAGWGHEDELRWQALAEHIECRECAMY
jgi:hypothetical protein